MFSSPPLREHSGGTSTGSAPSLPQKSDRGGRWPSLPKIWNRRKSTGATSSAAAVVQDPLGPRDRCEKTGVTGGGDDGGGGGGGGVSDQVKAGRTIGRRTASAPVIAESASVPSSRSTRVRDGGNSLGDSKGNAATATESLEGPHSRNFVVTAASNAGDAAGEKRASSRARCGTITTSSTTPHPTRQRQPGGGDDTGEGEHGGHRCHRRGGSQGAITSPNSADVLSAPFLVARISGVGAELKDIMWAVRQTHFPYLKTAGSLQATLSGLTIEVELDAQDLPAGRGKDQDGGIANDGVSSGGNMISSGDGGGGDRGGGPTGLKLTRLRVSVLSVKVHVKNTALSAVYNLAASAFEAAVKRYVVENVEAAVRRNVSALLTIVNTQLSAKWEVLCKVGGGGRGGSGGDHLNPLAGSAVEKVLAASLSHHLVWPTDSSGNTVPASPAAAKSAPVADQPSVGQVSHLERMDSGSSRGSADSKEIGGGGSGDGMGAGVGTVASARAATSIRKRLAKQSFRIRGSVDKAQSAEETSKLLSSSTPSSASSSSSSIPKLANPSCLPPPTSSGRTQLYTRRQVSPTLSSRNSSSTTLSEWETGTMAPPPGQEAVPVKGTAAAGGRVQERRRVWRRVSVPSALKDQRRMSASPPRKYPRGLRRIGDAEKDAGVFSDGGVVGRQREAGTTKDYWKDSPPNTAAVMAGRPAGGGSVWVGDS